MKPQTADNLRCLAAAVFVFGIFGVLLASPKPAEWIQIAGFLALLLLTVRLFNFRRTIQSDRVVFDHLMITNVSADGQSNQCDGPTSRRSAFSRPTTVPPSK